MKSKYVFANIFDSSMNFGTAKEVYYPENVEEIKEIVKYCKDKMWPITVRGGASSLTGSSVPRDSVVVNMLKMNHVIEVSDNEVIVESGIILDQLNDILEEKGLYFPIQPSSHNICTIGGMISCNAAGKEAIRYGKTLNWVNWIEIIDANGNIVKVKSLPPYSEGMLGVICRASLNVIPKIKNRGFKTFLVDDVSELLKLVSEFKKKKVLSIEAIGKFASNLIYGINKYVLIIESDSLENFDEKPKINRDIAYSKLSSLGYSIIQDPQINADNLFQLISLLENKSIPWFGHIGVGILHPCFKSFKDADHFLKQIVKFANPSGEHGYGLLKKEFRPKDNKEQIIKLKSKYDAFNLFNPHLL